MREEREVARIVGFIKKVLQAQGFKNVILAASGGIDSTTSLFLLARAIKPKNIFVVHLPYSVSHFPKVLACAKELGIPNRNVFELSIKPVVDKMISTLTIRKSDKIRIGNVMARTRMIVLYDLAKKYQALVCGTENKSEFYLGYFTRFGDEASDFEPIRHLFKTQVYQLASYLGVPKEIITQSPTARLWQGQTDEKEFGFTYQEADQVLFLHFDKKKSLTEIEQMGFANAEKVLGWCRKNDYKHYVPYIIQK